MRRVLLITFGSGCLLLLLGAVAIAAETGGAPASANAEPPTVEALVRQLGDDSFKVRQSATQQLIEHGLAAKPALIAALHDPDAEIRLRARRVWTIALTLDRKARVSAFVADQDVTAGHNLPGWERYRALAGDDTAARELFVEIMRAEPELCEAAEAGPEQVGAMLQARCEQLQQRTFAADGRSRRGILLGSVAALFFVASNPDVTITDPLISYLHTFSYQPTFLSTVANSERSAPLKKLLGAWITRPNSSINSYQNFVLALQFDLREGLAPAMALLRDGGAQPHVVQYALLLVGKFGSRADIPLVVPLLNDQMLLGSYTVNDQEVRTELRDVALAVLVQLTGQDFPTYGFDHLMRNPATLFQPVTAGFTTQDKREAALARWQAWVAAQPREETPPRVSE